MIVILEIFESCTSRTGLSVNRIGNMKFSTIAQLHKELRSKAITTSTILKVSHERISQTKDLNAYVALSPESANQAQISQNYLDEGKPRSILEGIPIAVKDNFCVKNMTATCCSNMLKNFSPTYTATVVDKLFKSGAVIIGKTNMDEFAMGSGTIESIYGPTKNIWGTKHVKNADNNNEKDWVICGGSSGGSAIAVASGTCLGAIGSDTGGSTRNPASYCGVIGLKPTYGLLSRHGLIPLVNSMDVPGILSNNIEDAFTLLKIMAGHDVKDSTTVESYEISGALQPDIAVKGLKVGIPIEYNCEGLSDEVKDTWKMVAEILEKGGAKVIPISMPHTKHSIVCYSVLNSCEVASNMAKYDGVEFGIRSDNKYSTEQMYADTRSKNFNLVVRRRILAGNYFLLGSNYEKYFVKAMKIRRLIANDFSKAWESGCNVLLTPTTLTDAPKYSDFIKQDEREQCAREDYCTQPANMSGCPAVSVPIKFSQKGLPLSIQLMAPNFEDKKMLEVAQFIENEVQFQRLKNEYL